MTRVLERPFTGTLAASVFGAVHLSYLVVESQRLTAWHRFGADAIGLHVDELDADTLRFRLDDHRCRFLVRRGPAEDLMAIGWQVDDHATFERILARLVERGVPIAEGTADEARRRGVEQVWRFPGPKGIVQEIFTRPLTTDAPLRMISSGFVTGEAGMGHVAITSRGITPSAKTSHTGPSTKMVSVSLSPSARGAERTSPSRSTDTRSPEWVTLAITPPSLFRRSTVAEPDSTSSCAV